MAKPYGLANQKLCYIPVCKSWKKRQRMFLRMVCDIQVEHYGLPFLKVQDVLNYTSKYTYQWLSGTQPRSGGWVLVVGVGVGGGVLVGGVGGGCVCVSYISRIYNAMHSIIMELKKSPQSKNLPYKKYRISTQVSLFCLCRLTLVDTFSRCITSSFQRILLICKKQVLEKPARFDKNANTCNLRLSHCIIRKRKNPRMVF